MAVTFGDRDRICFGPCDPGNLWIRAVRYSREVARITGSSEVQVQKEMSDYALTGLTTHEYAADVLADMGRYLLEPTAFEARFHPSRPSPTAAWTAVARSSEVIYFAFLAAMTMVMLLVARTSFRTQVVSILLKLFMAAMLIQPFVHISSGRYWPVFAPLFGLAAALLAVWVRERGRPRDSTPAPDAAVSALVWVQAVLAAGFVVVLASLWVLSA
jgi:hypothetical protein